MQVTKEQVDPCTVSLDIKIEPDTVSRAFGQAYREFGKFTSVPGFRPGKAPRSMVERYVNPDKVRERVMEIVAGPAYREALQNENISPYADPEVEFSDLADGQEWQFKAIVPLPPNVELGDYSDLTVERPVFKVSDEDVDRQIENIRNEYSRMEKVDGRGVQQGDVLIAEMTETIEGQEPPAAPRRTLIRVGESIPGFDDQILGIKPDEEREFDLTYPEDHQDPERAGKKAHFTVRVASNNQRVLPEVTDEWVEQITPYKTVEELRNAIREGQQEQVRDLSDRVVESRIVEELIKRSKVEFPHVMVEQEMQDEAHELGHELDNRKMSYEEYLEQTGQTQEQHRAKMEASAVGRVQSVLVLRELARKLNLQVTDQELSEELTRIAAENNLSDEDAQNLARDERRRTQIANIIVKRKLRDHLFETVNIKDVEAKAE
jgi:trigger factor